MKKTILFVFCATVVLGLFAGKTLNIYKSDASIATIDLSSVDSMKFSGGNAYFDIYMNDKSTLSYTVAQIDSMIVQIGLPVVRTSSFTYSSSTLSAIVISNVVSGGDCALTERGICWSTSPYPTINDSKYTAGSSVGQYYTSMSGLAANQTYYVRAYAINCNGVAYGNALTVSTFSLPSVETVSATFNYTTNKATVVAKVSSNGGCALTERGICWGKTATPTVNDTKFSSGLSVGQFYALMSGLELNSTYYVRAYATNCTGTAYGTAIKVQPLMGNVTYTLNIDSAALPEQYRLIKIAVDSACWYFNRYTTFRGNVYVYYSSGIPTAQASYHGSLGFGSNTRYMWVGTALHEMCHYMGSGTTAAWQANIVNGVWVGKTASALLLSLTGETLKGDSQHFWPYGVNQKEEITNLGSQAAQEAALATCAKLCKAMCVDDSGLPSSW